MVGAAGPGGWGGDRAGWVMVADGVVSETGPADFGILGPLEVSRSGCVVPLGGPRQRAVLALLVLEANRVVSMDRLAEDVWGGDPPEGWVTTLQTYVFHLRRALEPARARGVSGGVLVTRNHGYLLLVNREHLDAAQFQDGFTAGRAALEAGRYAEAAETLREALALWRSPVLADLADYAFIRPEAARLEELRLAALEARIDADLALGRPDALTAELEHLAAEHPLRERLHGQLMLALYRCGRQAEALAAYRRARDLLADQLGIDPGEPLRHLHGSVLAHDPALDWSDGRETVAEVHPAGSGSPAPPPAPQRRRPRPAPGSHVPGWGTRRGHRLLVAGLALVVIAAAVIAVVARPWAGGPAGLPGNSVGLIDTSGGRVGAAVSVGSPAGLAYGDGSVWAVNGTEGTVSRINPATHAVVEQVPVGSSPSAVAVTGENVWHAGLKSWTTYLFLNTREPPFTSLKARQAVNYAIDRGRILQLLHRAPGQAAVTCQILPADFPGHQSYCPYTTGTKDRIWHGPDMAKARRLAKDSHTTNVPVTVWTFQGFANGTVNSYLVRLLKDLGYRARQRTVSPGRFFTAVANAHSKIQAGLNAWGADFPTASGIFLPVLSCRSFYQDPTNTLNYAGFCDPRADQLASQAQAAQLTDPATARRLWAQVDRLVTDQAPWVPILSHAPATFVSARIGNYQQSSSIGPLLDQMWVR